MCVSESIRIALNGTAVRWTNDSFARENIFVEGIAQDFPWTESAPVFPCKWRPHCAGEYFHVIRIGEMLWWWVRNSISFHCRYKKTNYMCFTFVSITHSKFTSVVLVISINSAVFFTIFIGGCAVDIACIMLCYKCDILIQCKHHH